MVIYDGSPELWASAVVRKASHTGNRWLEDAECCIRERDIELNRKELIKEEGISQILWRGRYSITLGWATLLVKPRV